MAWWGIYTWVKIQARICKTCHSPASKISLDWFFLVEELIQASVMIASAWKTNQTGDGRKINEHIFTAEGILRNSIYSCKLNVFVQ